MSALTFIVPAYNVATTLGDTLRSILAQTRPDWSAVVVDDGSTDETPAVAAAFADDPRIRVVRQENRGLSGARNRGVQECRRGGDVLCFLDADDVVEPSFSERMLAALSDTFDLAACWYRMTGANLEDLSWTIRTGDHDMAPSRLIEYNPYAPGAIVVRRSAAERTMIETPHGPGLFDTSLCVHEDWDAWMRLSAPPPLGAGAKWAPVVAAPLFCYRQRPDSMSGQLERMWRVGQELIERAPVGQELKPGAIRRWSIRHIARAAARGDAELAMLCRQQVGRLAEDETRFLAGCLRWSLCQQDQIGPGYVDAQREAQWRERVASVLGDDAREVLSVLTLHGGTQDGNSNAWGATLKMLRERLRPDDELVIYGIGRNGRDLLAALELENWQRPLAWIDDDPAAAAPVFNNAPLPRARPDALLPNTFVIITPDDSLRIVESLRRRGIERIQVGPSRIHPQHPHSPLAMRC